MTRLSYNFPILAMCSELGLGHLQVSTMGSFEKISVIYCRKGLQATCFQGSVILL